MVNDDRIEKERLRKKRKDKRAPSIKGDKGGTGKEDRLKEGRAEGRGGRGSFKRGCKRT